MNGHGFHWTACRGGGDVKVILAGGGVFAAAIAIEWVTSHAWEILAVTTACGALAVAAVVALMRWTDRRAAAFGAALAARREQPALTATVLPQVSQPVRPAIPQAVIFNFYGAGSTMAARVIRQQLPGQSGAADPERN